MQKTHSITAVVTLLLLGYGLAWGGLARAASAEADAEPAQATNSNAAPGVTIIEGDRMEIHFGRSMRSIGDASMHQNNQDIYGDTIDFDLLNGELHVVGNARYEGNGNTVSGPELRLRLSDSIGEMEAPSFTLNATAGRVSKKDEGKAATDIVGTLFKNDGASATAYDDNVFDMDIEDSSGTPAVARKTSGSRGDAKVMYFEGPDKKHLKSATYTTCEAGRDDWYLKASDLEIDSYSKSVTARNARIEFQGIPILYTPWINFSYINQRKSGFLQPTVGTTSLSGFEVSLPYYWNIGPDRDATLTPRYLSKRGVQLQGQFRYLQPNYSGIDSIEYLPNDDITGRNRDYENLNHEQVFGHGWSGGFHFEHVSDDQYFSDLSTHIIVTSQVNLSQQAHINYAGDVWQFNGLVQKFQTLDGVSYPYERLPDLTLNGNKDWGPGKADIKTQWVKFDRSNVAPLTVTEPNGAILTTAVTGERFNAYPSFTVPLPRPYGYITPKFGISYTDYKLDNPGFILNGVPGIYQSDSRTLPIFSVDSGLFFERNLRVVNNNYTQTLEPRLYYVYIPYRNQSNLPVFDSGQSDVNLSTLFSENQFSGYDRINNANQLSMAVTTRLIDNKTGTERLVATLGYRYFFSDLKVGLPGTTLPAKNPSDIVTAITARLLNHWNLDAGWQFNTDTARTTKANIGTSYNPEPGKVLNLSYRYTKGSVEQINISGEWRLGGNWYGLGRWNYDLLEHHNIEGLAGLEYDAGCWQARTVLQSVSTATANTNYAIFIQLELGGIASIGANPLDLIKRSIPGYTGSDLIPDAYKQPNQ